MDLERLGPYRLVRELGRGGMGAVYQGINDETDESAAIKVLATGLAQKEGFRDRFSVEIETLRKLRHPNIVRLFGFGEEAGTLYFVMELVDGKSLEQELHDGRQFEWPEVVDFALDMCRALKHAHDRGVIHRDIKPANLLLTPRNQLKLTDFGIARLFGNTGMTAVGSVIGTVEFMAPEQADARPVGPPADLYSLGGVLYTLLAGRPPFMAKSLLEMLEKQRSAIPDPVNRYAPDVPAELVEILSQLLEKDPAKRIASSVMLSRRLEALRENLGTLVKRSDQTDFSMGSGTAAEDGESDADTGFDLGPSAAPDDPSDRETPDATRLSDVELAMGATMDPPPSADDLPDTLDTAAFQDPTPREKEETEEPEEADEAEEPSGKDRFTTVAEEDLDRAEEKPSPPLISIQTLLLIGSLVTLTAAAWYMLRPLSADALYAKIARATVDKSIESLLDAEEEIEEFLAKHYHDPRSPQLLQYQQEIDLHELERGFVRKTKGLAGAELLSPVEQSYLDAINFVQLDPELGLTKLASIVELYGSENDGSTKTYLAGPTAKCLELVRRRKAQLEMQLGKSTVDYPAILQERLDRADQLVETDPDQARRMYEAVVELYDHKAWARAAVDRARASLTEMPQLIPALDEPQQQTTDSTD